MSNAESQSYEDLFADYLKELRWAFEESQKRQDALVRRSMDEQDLDEEAARKFVVSNFGCLAQHGHVLYVLRKYWLAVDRIKKERMATRPDDGWLEPLTFLIEDLRDADEEDLVDLLSELPYWPIGIDPEMNWC